MAKGFIRWNSDRAKYELTNKQGRVLVRSKKIPYLEYLVAQGKHQKVKAQHVTELEIVSRSPDDSADLVVGGASPLFSIEERFLYMDQLIGMIFNGTARSMIISGEGGIGKTFEVLRHAKTAGKLDYNAQQQLIALLDADSAIVADDDEEKMLEKVTAKVNREEGDFVVVKGYASAAGLFRLLWTHRHRTMVFDDCDSIFKDSNSLSLLKSALDSYEKRYVSWNVERQGDSDLPGVFEFEGSIIFISNLPLHKIDGAVRTRAYKVDISMTKQQCIERLRSQLEGVLPDVPLPLRQESLQLIEKHQAEVKNINFRSLLDVINIRQDFAKRTDRGETPRVPWEKLALFALMEGAS